MSNFLNFKKMVDQKYITNDYISDVFSSNDNFINIHHYDMKRNYGLRCDYYFDKEEFGFLYLRYPDMPSTFMENYIEYDNHHIQIIKENEPLPASYPELKSRVIYNDPIKISREVKYIDIEKPITFINKLFITLYSTIYTPKKNYIREVDKIAFITDFKNLVNELFEVKPELFHDNYC